MKKISNYLVLFLVFNVLEGTYGLSCFFTTGGHGVGIMECPGSCVVVWLQRETLHSYAGCSQTAKPTDCHRGTEKIENICYCNDSLCNKPFIPTTSTPHNPTF